MNMGTWGSAKGGIPKGMGRRSRKKSGTRCEVGHVRWYAIWNAWFIVWKEVSPATGCHGKVGELELAEFESASGIVAREGDVGVGDGKGEVVCGRVRESGRVTGELR